MNKELTLIKDSASGHQIPQRVGHAFQCGFSVSGGFFIL